jgi:hypothetical protein
MGISCIANKMINDCPNSPRSLVSQRNSSREDSSIHLYHYQKLQREQSKQAAEDGMLGHEQLMKNAWWMMIHKLVSIITLLLQTDSYECAFFVSAQPSMLWTAFL